MSEAAPSREALILHARACESGEAGYLDPDSQLFVLTSVYLEAQGSCCGRGCRHCPWPVDAQNAAGRPATLPVGLETTTQTHPMGDLGTMADGAARFRSPALSLLQTGAFKPDQALKSNALDDDVDESEPPRQLVCRACQHLITDHNSRRQVDGRTHHRFTNPNGYTFLFDTFGAAVGVRLVGTASQLFSWFSGYSWQFAHCGGCGVHLGWFYDCGTDDFHGLICDRLQEIQRSE